jgi:hypothetical protein
MKDMIRAPAEKRKSAGAVAAFVWRGLFMGVGLVLLACVREMIDSFSDGFSELLFDDEI